VRRSSYLLIAIRAKNEWSYASAPPHAFTARTGTAFICLFYFKIPTMFIKTFTVKFTLEQVMKAKEGSRDITILLL
jgi:hypothetical protein